MKSAQNFRLFSLQAEIPSLKVPNTKHDNAYNGHDRTNSAGVVSAGDMNENWVF
jgi:hypothetical protein